MHITGQSQTWIEINKETLYQNVQAVKRLIGDVSLGVVLKANAYGHGLKPMAVLLHEHPLVEVFFVGFGHEALELRRLGITKPIVAFVVDVADLDECIIHGIDIVCFEHGQIRALQDAAVRVKAHARIHLKIDTGMSRLGFFQSELEAVIDELHGCDHIKVVAIMSHLSDADNIDPAAIAFTKHQLTCFRQSIEHYAQRLPFLECVHICASSGTLFFEKGSQWLCSKVSGCTALVRVATNIIGCYKPDAQSCRITQYGLCLPLKSALTWKTRIIQVKTVPAGSAIGYGRTKIVSEPTKIAIIPIGYADGYPRGLSNCGMVLVQGKHVPVIGRVSMNLCTLDVSSLSGVLVGDEVILMGPQQGVTPDDVAQKIGSVNIVVLSSLRESIERVVV